MDRTTIPRADWLAAHARDQLVVEQNDTARACKICGGTAHRFDIVDFEKFVSHTPYTRPMSGVPVLYRKCQSCGFIFTSFFDTFTPAQWGEHVYNDEYKVVDGEFESIRPAYDAKAVRSYLGDLKAGAIGLDFGGGNGRTASLLRAAGWKFDCYDPFGLDDLKAERIGRYNLCTAFEVFEHLPEPSKTLAMVLEHTAPGPLLFMVGTALTDGHVTEANRLNWFYAGPRNGHISLFSRKALQLLAEQHGLELTSVAQCMHFMSRGHDPKALARRLKIGRVRLAIERRLLKH
jgi:Methyltransferase domain